MKRIIPWLLVLALLCGCAERAEEPAQDGYELYYAAVLSESDGGDAIRACTAPIEGGETLSTEELARALLERLLLPPEEAGLASPFPSGTQLLGLRIAGGRALVDLSAPYARLSGVELSLADGCVALTLTQLDGVNAVSITAEGRALPYRRTQLLTGADPLLSSREDTLHPINVSLYFFDAETGALRAQQQTLALYEGQTRVSALLDALLRGPEGDDTLAPLLPEDFSVLSARIEDGICYVNISANASLPADETLRQLAMESLSLSLASLGGVDEVQLLIEGESVSEPAPPPEA